MALGQGCKEESPTTLCELQSKLLKANNTYAPHSTYLRETIGVGSGSEGLSRKNPFTGGLHEAVKAARP